LWIALATFAAGVAVGWLTAWAYVSFLRSRLKLYKHFVRTRIESDWAAMVKSEPDEELERAGADEDILADRS